MKIIVVNGNTTEAVTQRMIAALRTRCPQTVQLTAVTAPFGMPYVATRAACVRAAHAVLDGVEAAVAAGQAAGAAPFDGCFYACFGEPGIEALRAQHAFPVAGMAEASILTALQLGERFSIVTVGAQWPAMLRDLLRRGGLDARCAGFGVVPGDALALARDRREGAILVRATLNEVMERQQPDVVIVGGAALAEYGALLDAEAPVPVVDSLFAGFEQALALARLGLGRRA